MLSVLRFLRLGLRQCLFTSLLACGCALAQSSAVLNPARFAVDKLSDRPPTFFGLPLQNGQLVVTTSAKPGDLFLLLFEQEYHPFSHIGVIAIEEGGVYIYDAQGDISSTSKEAIGITGGLRRQRFDEFLEQPQYFAVYDLPSGVDAAKTVAYAREQFLKKTPYDGVFDLDNSDAVYCSEYIERALLAGGAQASRRVQFSRNASVRALLDAIGAKSPAVASVGQLVSRSQRVAVVSREHSMARMALDFAIIEELWQRFTPNQKLGALYERTLTGIEFSRDVRQFIARAQEAVPTQTLAAAGSSRPNTANAPRADNVKNRVQALALEMFGPYQRSAN